MRLKNISFLEVVWGHTCVEGDYIFLSTKSKHGNWSDYSFVYNDDLKDKLEDWFDSHPPSKYDLYFCPLPYREKKRNINKVKPLNILWSDIDDGDPSRIEPTLLWESSPDRYQGLWFLDKRRDVKDIEQLNKDLAYYIGADKGGWDLTQVLRIPGTRNHKYDDIPRVSTPTDIGDRFLYKSLRKNIPSSDSSPTKDNGDTREKLKSVLDKFKSIPPDLKRKLLAKKVMGDRSKVIWSMENKLFECGISKKTILLLIKNSVWNKFKGRPEEDEILNAEVDKVERAHKKKEALVDDEPDEEYKGHTGFLVESYDGLLSSLDTYPGWLVEGFWLNNSHGIIAGEPKTFKSTLSLDFAVSVASGRNFLNKYEVHSQGPVIYIQNENAKWIMKDRIEKIAYSKGLGGRARIKKGKLILRSPEIIPLHFINTQSYLLNNEEHRATTEEVIRQYQPKLIVFDPLYLMYDGDLNAAKELNPILGWLLGLKSRFNCAVMLIHHYNKGNASNGGSRGGQRMLGSTTLHGWIESAWYVKTENEDDKDTEGDEVNKAETQSDIIIEREFRGAGVHPRVDLRLSMGSLESNHYKVETRVHHGKGSGKKSDLSEVDGRVLNFLHVQKESVSQRFIASELGISRTLVKDSLDRLIKSNVVDEVGRGIYQLF